MVVEVFWQAVLHDLLEDNYETGDELFVTVRVRLYGGRVVVERGGHNAGVLIAESLPHELVNTFNRLRIDAVETMEYHNRLLAHHFMHVREQPLDRVLHSRHNRGICNSTESV